MNQRRLFGRQSGSGSLNEASRLLARGSASPWRGWVPFVLNGAPLFKVFPRFGELLLGGTEPRWLVHGLGWTYHFSNGAALGIMFLVMASCFRRPTLFWGAIAWAVFVEAVLLLMPYAAFFGLKLNG